MGSSAQKPGTAFWTIATLQQSIPWMCVCAPVSPPSDHKPCPAASLTVLSHSPRPPCRRRARPPPPTSLCPPWRARCRVGAAWRCRAARKRSAIGLWSWPCRRWETSTSVRGGGGVWVCGWRGRAAWQRCGDLEDLHPPPSWPSPSARPPQPGCPADDIYTDVCLKGAATKQARQLALALRDHPAGASSRHLLTSALGCAGRPGCTRKPSLGAGLPTLPNSPAC